MMRQTTGINAVLSVIIVALVLLLSQLSATQAINQVTALYVIASLGLLAFICWILALWRLRDTGIGGLAKPAILIPLVVGTALGGWNSMILFRGLTVPPIHDISTDTKNPPQFVALRAERMAAPNGAEWGGSTIAMQQHLAYPDITTLYSALQPVQAFVVMRNIIVARKWDVADSNPGKGVIEASVRTRFMGFVDDVVIRILPDGKGSRVDIRSMSRVGQSDLGANADRVRLLRQEFTQQATDFSR